MEGSTTKQTTAWLDQQAKSPLPIWAFSALSFATVPAAARKLPGVPSLFQSMAFGAIFAGAGYVTYAGDDENGAGIATAWCLSWSFLNARSALRAMKPIPVALLAMAAFDTAVYGKKTLEVNGFI